MTKPYTYHFRPAFKSNVLLIEFLSGVEEEGFITNFLDEITEFEPKIESINDLWMNDEVVYNLNTNIGKFELSKDNWGTAFLFCQSNQDGIKEIESKLLKSEKFERIEVNFDDYK